MANTFWGNKSVVSTGYIKSTFAIFEAMLAIYKDGTWVFIFLLGMQQFWAPTFLTPY